VIAIEPSVVEVLEQYKSAVYAKDAEALIRLYDTGVRVFDAWGIWSYDTREPSHGRVPWRAGFHHSAPNE
jgi:hypothetical protein